MIPKRSFDRDNCSLCENHCVMFAAEPHYDLVTSEDLENAVSIFSEIKDASSQSRRERTRQRCRSKFGCQRKAGELRETRTSTTSIHGCFETDIINLIPKIEQPTCALEEGPTRTVNCSCKPSNIQILDVPKVVTRRRSYICATPPPRLATC